MDIAVPSRFSCLKIEDDEIYPQNTRPKDVKKKTDKKSVKKPDKLQKLPSSQKPSDNKQINTKKEKKKPNVQQWQEWKQKDEELVNGTYEEDLQNAILLSKLDYEHNKEMYKQLQEAAEKEKNQNKKKKNKAMSLDQFLNSGNANNNQKTKPENGTKDQDFFKEVQFEAKDVFIKEQVREKRKKRESNIDEVISLAQCQQKWEQEKAKVLALQIEIERLKAENLGIKERNRTLCNILGQGEMKDKADVLLELERLYSEKNELSEEVSKLHILLEQERSKIASVANDSHNKHKDKVKK